MKELRRAMVRVWMGTPDRTRLSYKQAFYDGQVQASVTIHLASQYMSLDELRAHVLGLKTQNQALLALDTPDHWLYVGREDAYHKAYEALTKGDEEWAD